ncbi:MAG: cupin domain-containing protein [Succinivibrio sp.]
MNSNFTFASVDTDAPRTELHDLLKLTGAEISINNMAPDTEAPFFHHHKLNEECYIVLEGSGLVYTDGTETAIGRGSVFRMSSSVVRKIRAGSEGLKFLCIQCQENSLTQFTFGDGAIDENIQW